MAAGARQACATAASRWWRWRPIDARTAQAALAAIELDIEPLPAYFNAADARAAGAVLLHDDKPGNIEREVEQDFGDVDAGFAAADLVLERDYDCAEVAHGQIELERHRRRSGRPSASRLTVHSVTQVPYYLHLMLAQAGPGQLGASASSSPSSAAASATASSRSISRWSPPRWRAPPAAPSSSN